MTLKEIEDVLSKAGITGLSIGEIEDIRVKCGDDKECIVRSARELLGKKAEIEKIARETTSGFMIDDVLAEMRKTVGLNPDKTITPK
ncbi:MAG: hypothetical protein PHE67_00890 [Campylobacterales bacterium]|nr:hypothetical protein [Campylobacterales bacterium]